MIRRSFIQQAGAALLVAATLPLQAQERGARSGATPAARLDAYTAQALAAWGLPGTAVAVVHNDSVVFAKGFGVRELGKNDPVTPNSVFAIGSTSKAFTAATVAILVAEGKVKWDDPVAKHLPQFQLFDPYVTRELTVRDLLTHRSGLARGDRLWANSGFSRDEVLRRVRYLRPSWSFRSTYGYQNIMFLAAGTVVQTASGKSWDDFVAERIFQPLGMNNSVTSVTKLSTLADVATPHERLDSAYRPVPWLNIDNIGPAGSINSSVTDMAQWIRLQLNRGTYKGKRLLDSAAVKEMHTANMSIRPSAQDERLYPMSNLSAYGLGWSLRDYYGKKMVSHGGAIRGMRAQVTLIPDAKLGVVVLTNSPQSAFPTAIANKAVDLYLGNPDRDWSALILKEVKDAEVRAVAERKRRESERVTGTSPSLPLTRYAGVYADSMYGDVQVTEESNKLRLQFGPFYTSDLAHWHFDTFESIPREQINGRFMVRFVIDAAGKVSALDIDGVATFGRKPATGATVGGQQ
ncbi:MAG TPA: serine hydrolase [Gemmatimonadaceae bacterium]|nr:serine hydrolase [Gemmatimonadaceae bacterium]